MVDTVVDEKELERRTIRRDALVSCNQAFIDCKTPGSDTKENYALIGSGVSQSSDQVINLQEPHGYNIGAAAMPNGITNNLHMHFTAEVFLNFGGDWLFRWGVDGKAGEYLSHEGDIVTVPTWIYRGFTNVGRDDGWLFTALGMNDTGGIIWGPSVLTQAAEHGLYLTRDNQLVDVSAGQSLPVESEVIRPMPEAEIAALRSVSAEEMRSRVTTPEDRRWCDRAFLCSSLRGGRAELALVIGYGMTEDRDQAPRVFNPHGFNVAWLRAAEGEGLLRHRTHETQVLIVKSGRWRVRFTDGSDDSDPADVVLEPHDTLSVPPGAWRELTNLSDDTAELVVVNGSDGRVRIEWDPEVEAAALRNNMAYDANGYLAPYSVVSRSVEDD